MNTLQRIIDSIRSAITRTSAGAAADKLTVGVLKDFGVMRAALAKANDLYDIEVDAIGDEIEALEADLAAAEKDRIDTMNARVSNDSRVAFLDQFLSA